MKAVLLLTLSLCMCPYLFAQDAQSDGADGAAAEAAPVDRNWTVMPSDYTLPPSNQNYQVFQIEGQNGYNVALPGDRYMRMTDDQREAWDVQNGDYLYCQNAMREQSNRATGFLAGPRNQIQDNFNENRDRADGRIVDESVTLGNGERRTVTTRTVDCNQFGFNLDSAHRDSRSERGFHWRGTIGGKKITGGGVFRW